eukprot:scaffold84751_cov19-Prasinocladus_malaysianus.AAC.1
MSLMGRSESLTVAPETQNGNLASMGSPVTRFLVYQVLVAKAPRCQIIKTQYTGFVQQTSAVSAKLIVVSAPQEIIQT